MEKQVSLADIEAAIKVAKANKLPYCCKLDIRIYDIPLKVYQQVLNKYPEFIEDLRLNKIDNIPHPYYSTSANYEGSATVIIYSSKVDKLKIKLENEKRVWEHKLQKMQEMVESINTELANLDRTEEATEKEIAELIPTEDKQKMYF